MKREHWILINDVSSAVNNLNSAFCDDLDSNDDGECQYSSVAIKILAEGIAEKCTKMGLEDAIMVLRIALEDKH